MLAPIIALIAVGSPKLVSIVWDGAADWVVDKLLAEGKLPNVARLAATGIRAESVIPAWPSKTAVGHAAIFTGAWSDVNGVSNNTVPLLPEADHTIWESRRGFDGNSLLAEPIWVTAAKAGRRVLALSAACSFPPDPFVAQIRAAGGDVKKFVEFSGFESSIANPQMIRKAESREFTFKVGDQTFSAKVYDDPGWPVVGCDSIELRCEGMVAVIHPSPGRSDIGFWSPPFRVQARGDEGNVYFRLFSLDASGRSFELYQRKVAAIRGTETGRNLQSYIAAYGAHHDDPFQNYENGLFGTPIYEGGDGEAERRVLEIIRQDCEFLKRSFAYGWKTWRPDVLLHYTPMSDSAGHTWMGALDPENFDFDPVVAKKLWPYYEGVYQLQDEWLGFVMDTVGQSGIVSLASDHGMAGVRRNVYINKVLSDAGLVHYDGQKKIEGGTSCIFVPNWSDFFLTLNKSTRKDGWVTPAAGPELIARAKQALLSVRDPEGRPVVTGVFEPGDLPSLGIGGPTGGDLYFELAPGYYPSNRYSEVVTGPYTGPIGGGAHGFMPFRRKMGAIFYASGPGLRNRVISPIRQIDIMPTLCAAIGIPAPKQATGHAIGEALRK